MPFRQAVSHFSPHSAEPPIVPIFFRKSGRAEIASTNNNRFVGADALVRPIDHREGTGRCGHRPLHFYFNAYAANYDLS